MAPTRRQTDRRRRGRERRARDPVDNERPITGDR